MFILTPSRKFSPNTLHPKNHNHTRDKMETQIGIQFYAV